MRKLFLSVLCAVGLSSLSAQERFVERLEKPVSGQGTVRVMQDDEITRLVNGDKENGMSSSANQVLGEDRQIAGDDNAPVVSDKPKRKMKATGYRIQVYAGGNSRTARQEAQRVAGKVKQYFGDWAVYTHFQSPRWICRVGDFRTYEEASQALREMRETRQFDEALIVKSVILIPY